MKERGDPGLQLVNFKHRKLSLQYVRAYLSNKKKKHVRNRDKRGHTYFQTTVIDSALGLSSESAELRVRKLKRTARTNFENVNFFPV